MPDMQSPPAAPPPPDRKPIELPVNTRRSGPVLLAVVIAAASVAAAFDYSPALWGLAGYGWCLFVVLLAATSALLLAVAVKPVAASLGRLFLALPLPTSGAGPFLVGLATIPLFFLLRTAVLMGDWRLVLERLMLDHYYPSNLWTNYLHRLTGLLAEPFGALPDDAIALGSAVAGGVFVAFALRLAGQLGANDRGGVRFAFWFALLTGSTLVFFGHLEVYAPLVAATAAYLDTLMRVRRGRLHPGVAGLVLGVAVCFHGAAALLLPPLLIGVARWSPNLRLRRCSLTLVATLLPAAVSVAVLYFIHWRGGLPEDPSARYGTFLGAAGQGLFVPWMRGPGAAAYQHGLGDPAHWADRLNILLRIAPVALLLAVVPLLCRGRRRFPDDAVRADFHDQLRLVVVVLLAWTAVHNLSFPAGHDWDLFAFVAVPLAALAAMSPRPPSAARAGTILALCLYTALPVWLTSIYPPSDEHAAQHFALARAYQHLGGPRAERAFTRHLARAARADRPPHKQAVEMLSLYYATRRRPEAEAWLERAARGYPGDARIRANLGLWYHWRKKYAPALENLALAVRAAPELPVHHLHLGRLLFEIQRFEAGYRSFREAARLAPADREVVYEAIDAANRVNQTAEELRMLVLLHESHPEDLEILDRLVEWHKRSGSLEEAQRYQEMQTRLHRKQQRAGSGD